MKKKDTALYKIKVCATSILMCGLFAVVAVGCSNQEADNPDKTENNENGSSQNEGSGLTSNTGFSKITLPTKEPSKTHQGDSTGNDPSETPQGDSIGNNPSETEFTIDGNKITMGIISFAPITKPDVPDETTTVAEATTANIDTSFSFSLPQGTINTQDVFVIGEDTTPTKVYGFND